MFEQFRAIKLNTKSKALLTKAQEIIEEYRKMSIRITLRQLYYQLVSRGYIENKLKEYHKISALLTNARYGGFVDWNAIEDRIRRPRMPGEWTSIKDLCTDAMHQYRKDRWYNQDYYIELFTEKDALSSILAPIAYDFHIHFCVNRGYNSATAMYDLAKRIASKINEGKKVKVMYLGDFDPSGLDMVRDIRERITEFLEEGDHAQDGNDAKVIHIALTREQINKYNPPPNPAKKSDPRSKKFIAMHGATSWEVDALPPDVMIKLVKKEIEKNLNQTLLDEIIQQEENEKTKLKGLLEKMNDDSSDTPDVKPKEKKSDKAEFCLYCLKTHKEGKCPIFSKWKKEWR